MTTLAFAVVALAAYRTWKLLADDAILDRPRAWALRVLPWDEFLTCPWCAGFWISLAWAGAWWADSRSVFVAVPFALSALVGILAALVDRLTGEE